MKKLALVVPILLLLIAGVWRPATAQGVPPDYYGDEAPPSLLSPDELDDLLAPIALYPDPLIAQILPAATFVDQIDEAARYVRMYGRGPGIDDQPWDLSVKAVAHYPDLLFMMDGKYDWTVALGQAYIDQPQDVMDAIQRLRAEAEAAGNLYSTREQQVIVEPEYISIVPASPEYVYVPVYDPDAIYYESYSPGYPIITFSTAFVIGAWLSRDCDWRRHRVFYHGWRGGGWIGRARPHIHDRRGVYINKRAAVINVNNRVLQHDTGNFRRELRTESVRRRENRPVTPPAAAQRRGRPAQGTRPQRTDQQRAVTPGTQSRPAPRTGAPSRTPAGGTTAPVPGAAPTTAPKPGAQSAPATPVASGHSPVIRPERPKGKGSRPQPTATDVFRGRDVQKMQPASQSGYGGYGSSRDAAVYRQRGASSREQMQRGSSGSSGATRSFIPSTRPAATPAASRPVTPAPAPRPAPAVQRPAAPAPAARPSAPSMPRPAAPSVPHAAPGGTAPGGAFQRR